MNERVDLNKILKDCPKGWKFWSPLFGEVNFHSMDSDYVDVEIDNEEIWTFNTNATITFSNRESLELMLFPSKEQRDWNKFAAPWYKNENKFDPKSLIPFDKVLVRNIQSNNWDIEHFSHIDERSKPYQFYCLENNYAYCIPCNHDTEHLVGTTDEPQEFYRYWEEDMKEHFTANNMEKKELVVRDLIKKLLDFNPDAKVTINLTSVPFPLYSDFSLCWGNDNAGDSCASLEERLESRKTASDVMFDFTSPER